jgi:hypothetical protein
VQVGDRDRYIGGLGSGVDDAGPQDWPVNKVFGRHERLISQNDSPGNCLGRYTNDVVEAGDREGRSRVISGRNEGGRSVPNGGCPGLHSVRLTATVGGSPAIAFILKTGSGPVGGWRHKNRRWRHRTALIKGLE